MKNWTLTPLATLSSALSYATFDEDSCGLMDKKINIRHALEDSFTQGVFILAVESLFQLNKSGWIDDCVNPIARKFAVLLANHTQLKIDYKYISKAQTIAQLRERIIFVQQIYEKEFRKIIEILNLYKDQWVVIKGMALASHYPYPNLRDKWDVDLYIQDFSVAMNIVSDLLELGSTFDDMSVKLIGRERYGWKVHLFSPEGVPIEFHIGPFQAYSCGILETHVFESPYRTTVNNTVFAITDVSTQLLYIAAHAYRNGFITLKDVNDAHVILTTTEIDSDIIREQARKSSLLPVLYEIFSKVHKQYGTEKSLQTLNALRPNIIEKIVGSLLGMQRNKSSHAFQFISFPAHIVYLVGQQKRNGWLRTIKYIGERVLFGLEHQLFPERDGRRMDISPKLRKFHEIFFKSRPLYVTPFRTGYFELVYNINLKELDMSWEQIYVKLISLPMNDGWLCKPFAQHLILYIYKRSLFLILSPIGFLVPLTYYKENMIGEEYHVQKISSLWSSLSSALQGYGPINEEH